MYKDKIVFESASGVWAKSTKTFILFVKILTSSNLPLIPFIFFKARIFFYKLLLNRFLNNNIALVGTLFFVLSPRIYASSFYNNKDLVFLSLATIALYYCFKSLEKINYKNLLIFSIFAAMCTSSRIFGIIFPVFFNILFSFFFTKYKNH